MSTAPWATAILSGPCSYCGGHHNGVCPRVKSIEYHGNGTVKRVEFHDAREPHGLGRDEYPPCHECGGQPNIVYEPGGHKDYPAEQGRVFVCSTKHGWATWPEFVAGTPISGAHGLGRDEYAGTFHGEAPA